MRILTCVFLVDQINLFLYLCKTPHHLHFIHNNANHAVVCIRCAHTAKLLTILLMIALLKFSGHAPNASHMLLNQIQLSITSEGNTLFRHANPVRKTNFWKLAETNAIFVNPLVQFQIV